MTDAERDRLLDLAEELVRATSKLRPKAITIKERLNRPEPAPVSFAGLVQDCEIIISKIREATE